MGVAICALRAVTQVASGQTCTIVLVVLSANLYEIDRQLSDEESDDLNNGHMRAGIGDNLDQMEFGVVPRQNFRQNINGVRLSYLIHNLYPGFQSHRPIA